MVAVAGWYVTQYHASGAQSMGNEMCDIQVEVGALCVVRRGVPLWDAMCLCWLRKNEKRNIKVMGVTYL